MKPNPPTWTQVEVLDRIRNGHRLVLVDGHFWLRKFEEKQMAVSGVTARRMEKEGWIVAGKKGNVVRYELTEEGEKEIDGVIG